MKKTIVPNRNMIFLSIAIGHAIAHTMDFVSYAPHAGDHAIYPDCKPEFADWIDHGASTGLCDWRKVRLLRPFVHLVKRDIVALGHRMGLRFENTWSCYEGGEMHCGRCGACVERREALHLAGITDKTPYAAPSNEGLGPN